MSIARMLDGLSQQQLRVIHTRLFFLALKFATDFLIAGGAVFTASATEAKGWPSLLAVTIAIIGGLIAAAKNLGDTINAALPPPVMANLDKSSA